MSLSITFHGDRPKDGPGYSVDVLGKQIGDVVTVTGSYTFPAAGLYRIKATADHTVRFGDSSLSAATNGESWAAGEKEVRFLRAGEKVYIS